MFVKKIPFLKMDNETEKKSRSDFNVKIFQRCVLVPYAIGALGKHWFK